MMLPLASALVALALGGGPTPNLTPSLAQIVLPPRPAFLAAAPEAAPEHHFSPGWLIAGVGGGIVAGSLGAVGIAAGGCHGTGGSAAGATVYAVVNVALGSALGIGAANGSEGAKPLVVIYDVVGTLAGLGLIAAKAGSCG
jgi:hypothetical protein